jgi:hypothetical protein
VIPATQEAQVGRSWLATNLGKSVRPYLEKEKNKIKSKRTEGMVQVVEDLLSIRP